MTKANRTRGRQRLIDATLQCLAEHGYHGSSVRKIAESAGVTAGLLKYYFDGKAELMVESYRHFKRSAFMVYMFDAANAGPDPARRLEAFVRSIFIFNADADRRQMKIWVSFLEPVITNPQVSTVQSEIYELFVQELSGIVTNVYADRGETLSSNSARKIAIGINSVIDGLWLECSLNPSRMTPEEALEIALDLVGARIGISFSNGASGAS